MFDSRERVHGKMDVARASMVPRAERFAGACRQMLDEASKKTWTWTDGICPKGL